MEKILNQLNICKDLVDLKGITGNMAWLNKFCATFLKFASEFKNYLPEVSLKYTMEGSISVHVETIFLCLTQVVTCITHMERIINKEEDRNNNPNSNLYLLARQHFVDRIDWCLRRIYASLSHLMEDETKLELEDQTFVELMDFTLDQLEGHKEKILNDTYRISPVTVKMENYDLNTLSNYIVRHALAFANVALGPDKRSLMTLCETLLRECKTFTQENEDQTPGERKLEALSLERALFSLEGLLNEALLRLVFACLLDVEEKSIRRLKQVLGDGNNSTMNQLIYKFDSNMDRIQQIGVFAIAFSQDVKTKTIIRNCLASLESLDACIVPAFQLQKSDTSKAHANILEQHLNEELQIFRNVLHEIIDSQSLVNNYLDMLSDNINGATIEEHEKVVEMAHVLVQHFKLAVNYDEFCEDGKELYEDFQLILRECQAIIKQPIPVDPKRIVKRLKILYSILAKLRDALEKPKDSQKGNEDCTKSIRSIQSVSKRHRSFVKPQMMVLRQENMSTTSNSFNYESEVINHQLTEILQIK